MYELEKENLKLFGEYIKKILRPSYIQGFLNEYLATEVVEKIVSAESSSVTGAAELFLEEICRLEEQGWFQALLDVLWESEYTGLHTAIKDWNFEELNQMESYKKLLEKVEASFTKNIRPVEIMINMQECFMPRECEEIKAIEEQRGSIAAAVKLTECLKRSDKSHCFKLLKLALQNCNCTHALDLLDTETNERKVVSEEDPEERTTTVCFEYKEDVEMETLASSIPEDHGEGAAAKNYEHPRRKQLREYQKELAAPAIAGENTIICAPTGCGKTLVGLAICEKHLEVNEKAKIVFMATKVEVYEQQYKHFREYFADHDIRITGVCGDMANQISMIALVEDNDIIVLTPQILLNALKTKELPSLAVFTLLIFDECHNASGKHPYNVLMNSYLDSKLSQKKENLPQIVGLTASVGIGTFKNQQEAEKNICQLCANLDVRVLSTVEDNKEELVSFVHTPEKEFFEVEKCPNDPFVAVVWKIMSSIVKCAKAIYNIDSLSNIHNSEYGTQKYEQWIVDVQKHCKILQLEDKEEESRICRALFNYTEHLRKYNDALIINEDARMKDALNYLDAFFQQIRQAGFDETEQRLTALFDEKRQQMVQLSESEDGVNPKLKTLKYILDEAYRNNDQTRTLLFVRTRALANALRNWIEETPSLKFLKPGVLVGRKLDVTGTGMTLTSQKGVLESFKNSNERKLLIATSVADEGIDIPLCNIVIMYEYCGNVVKMVQVRGRGRAEGSKCFLVSSTKERIEKERLNMHHEKIVEKAVVSLQRSQRNMLEMIERLQKIDKLQRDHISSTPNRLQTAVNNKLLCQKCKNFACFSDDLRVLQESHHVVLDKSFFERCITHPHAKPKPFDGLIKKMKVLCKECKNDWGIIASYKSFDNLPLIKIDSFVVENGTNQRQQYFRKWKDVNFSMREFDVTEIENW